MNENIIYAAGLFDGEGTVTLTRNNSNEKRSPAVSVSSTTFELVEFLKSTFGGHIITLSRTKKQGHKQAWHWQTTRNNAIVFLEQVLPYLKEPDKARRARLIVETFKRVTPRNGKYTPELLKQRDDFEMEFFGGSHKVQL